MFNFEQFLLTKSHAIFSIGSRQDIVLVISQIERANIEILLLEMPTFKVGRKFRRQRSSIESLCDVSNNSWLLFSVVVSRACFQRKHSFC